MFLGTINVNIKGQCFKQPYKSSHQRCSVKKGVLRNFAKFTGKHLCQSLFLLKLQANRTFCYRTSPVAASKILGISIEILSFPFQILRFRKYVKIVFTKNDQICKEKYNLFETTESLVL